MKEKCLLVAVMVLAALFFNSQSWSACPEDPIDLGVCDTLYVETFDSDHVYDATGTYDSVRVAIYVTHDSNTFWWADGSRFVQDSITGFVIPLRWSKAGCADSVVFPTYGNWNHKTATSTQHMFKRSIFRNIVDYHTNDTVYNRYASMINDLFWDPWTVTVNFTGNNAFLSMLAPGFGKWWEGQKTLLATLTFLVYMGAGCDSSAICLDSAFWPPGSNLAFTRYDAVNYVPRHYLPVCNWVGPPRIKVTSPDGGEVWVVGETHDITWRSPNFLGDNVKIEFSTDEGASWTTIIGSTPNDGVHPWVIPNTPSTLCRVRVSDAVDGVPADISDSNFTITAPIITVTYPNGGETWVVGSAVNITWTWAGSFTDVKIELSRDGGSTWGTLVASTPNDGSWNWTSVTGPPSTTCRVKISDAADGVPSDISNNNFTITSPANIAVTSPNGGESRCVDTTYNITWTSSGITDVKIEYSTDGGSSWITIIASTPAAPGTYPWTVPNTPSADSKVKICDAADNDPCDQSDAVFTIEACECVYPVHFVFRDSTEDSYSIVIDSALLDGLQLEECDEIGVFADTGGVKGLLCVGASAYHPEDLPIPLIAWKDDPLTDQKDGYTPGDTMYFRVWSKNQNREECATTHYAVGNGRFDFGIFSELWLEAPCASIVESITVTSPNGGEKWWEGSTHDITWTSANVDTVKIEYSTNGGSTWIVVVNKTPAVPGSYSWSVPNTPSDSCLVQICDAEDGAPCDTSDSNFYIVHQPDFTIDVTPDTLTVARGYYGDYKVILTSINDFASNCTLTVVGHPAGSTATFDPPVLVPTDSSLLTLFIPDTTSLDTFTLTITATEMDKGKGIVHSKDVTLIVTLPTWSFRVETFPDTQVIKPGDTTTYGVTIIPNVGFQALCTLFVEGLPSGAIHDFDPNTIPPNDTSTLTITTLLTTPVGEYDLAIIGVANLKQRDTTYVKLIIEEETGVDDENDQLVVPDKFALFQNQPNPFNPETKISYYLPEGCEVELTIYNILGRKVKILLDGYQNAGMKTVVWDGKDDQGSQLSSGIYFYRLQAGTFNQTRKMNLIK